MHLMELLGDVGNVEYHFGLFGDSVSVGARYARFALNVAQAQKSFWMHPMELIDDEAQVEASFRPFGDSANLDTR
jgi:hypothetical protein